MIDRVLVPMDNSEMAEKALEYAFSVHPEADISVLTVVGGPTPHMGEAVGLSLADDLEEAAETLATPIFESARSIASEYGRDVTTIVRLGAPIRVIVREAADYDVVIMGAHGRDIADRLLIGNVASTVTRRAPVPVTIVR